MKDFSRFIFLNFILIVSLSALAEDSLRYSADRETETEKNSALITNAPELQRDLLLGNIIKNGLEGLHFAKKKIDDDLSRKSFDEYIEMLDFGKRFFTQKDIKELSKYRDKIDDEMVNGRLVLQRKANIILNKRINEIDKYVDELLKKPMNLESRTVFEIDAEKRKFPKNEKELKEVWRNVLLVDVINNYLDIEEDQKELKDPKKDKDDKDKKKDDDPLAEPKITKILTTKQIEEEARKRSLKRYSRVFDRLKKRDHNDDLNKYFNSITKVFDPHTQYLPPREKKDFDISMSGSLEGIGAVLREDGNYIKVVEIIPGSASWKGKQLKTGDVILKVAQEDEKEGVDIVGMRVEDAVQLIRGKKGTTVKLTVKHSDASIQVIKIVRDKVTIEESYVKHSVIQREGSGKKLGYILVPAFYRDFSKSIFDKSARNCTDDVRNALIELKKQKVDGVILDLRNNAGGSLEDARQMSGLFIKTGPIVQVKNYEGKIDVLKDTDSDVVYDGPLVVMTNKFSASASEILAGALQDYGRAVIVGGEETHGKGTVQTLLDLDRYINPKLNISEPLGSIKLTIQKFYRINGGSTQYKGVVPDIVLPDPLSYVDSGERTQDYSLSWDTVDALSYEKWPKSYSINDLKKKSELRVKKNEKFQKIVKSLSTMEKRKEDTKLKLSLNNFRDRREKNRKESEKFKIDEVNEKIKVLNVSLDKKLLNEDQKERKEEWVDGLRSDPFIEETVHIMEDLFNYQVANKS